MTHELIRAIESVAAMPCDVADGLAGSLRAQAPQGDPVAIATVIASLPARWRDPVRGLLLAANSCRPPVSLDAVALAVQASCATFSSAASRHEVELVWSGPMVVQSTFRRTDRAWIDVIDAAQATLWLASFSVGAVERVEESLLSALDRGVDVRMLFEHSADSGGTLRYDGFSSFDRRVMDRARLYSWIPSKRELAPNGNIALMHAKAVVADAHAMFVTSANLSGAALERNLEVGVIVRGGPQPRWLYERFESLLTGGLIECRSPA